MLRSTILGIARRTMSRIMKDPIPFNYKGLVLYYDPTGVRSRLIRAGTWTYEEAITRLIVGELALFNAPTMLDIGAHIGFMILNVVASVPDTRIFAFEPGPRQFSLLERTIRANGLQERVTLYNQAVSRETGMVPFACQQKFPVADYSMGDGLLNTQRWGKAKTIQVRAQRLDDWWRMCGEPEINVMKIDAEGAELWILEGAIACLSCCRPLIVLELQPENLRAYPYDAKDVAIWLSDNGFRLMGMAGERIADIEDYLSSAETIVAKPV